jgi:Domain of unknown function (DUF4190)
LLRGTAPGNIGEVDPPQPAPSKAYALPSIAVACSILGLCFCPGLLVGPILGIIALRRIKREPWLAGRQLAIAAIVTPVAVFPILLAIAIPNFIRYQARSKQSECKVNLRALWTAEQDYQIRNGRLATSFAELEFAVPAGNRYAYLLSGTEVLPRDARYGGPPLDIASEVRKLELGVGRDRMLAACIGNIDQDPTLDVWTISSESRQAPDGTTVPAGTPMNEVNDVIE